MNNCQKIKYIYTVGAKSSAQLQWAKPITYPSIPSEKRFERIQAQLKAGTYIIDREKLAEKLLLVLTIR